MDEPDAPGAVPDPMAMPAALPPELRSDGAGTTPPVAINFGQKPLSETETETAERKAGPATTQAVANLRTAEQATDQASQALGVVEGKEADAQKLAAEAKARELDARRTQMWEAEQERKRYVDAAVAADRQEIEAERNARLDAGKARATFWEGRPGAEIFTRLLQVVGNVAHDLSGRSGPSPVDQAIEANVAAHEKRLLSRWEATREASVLKRQNRAAYLNELDRRKVEAINQSLLSIDLIGEQLNASIAGLSKEKQAAARAHADKSLNEKRAQLEVERVQVYDSMGKRTESQRTFPDGAGGGLKQGEAEAAGALTSMTTELKKFQDAKVSPEALKQWQKNQTLLAGDSKTEGQGSIGSRVVAGLRWAGLSPEQEFSGIGDADKAAILSRKRGLDQLSKIMTGAAATDSEVKRREQQWLIQPGDSDEIVTQKTQAFMDFIRDRSISAGAAAPAIRQNVEAARAPSAAATGPKTTAPASAPADARPYADWSDARLRAGQAEAQRRGKSDPRANKAWNAFAAELKAREERRRKGK
ncbi:MAG TPA: hypothetical protein VJ140_01180 [Actinomycetota bacterium]|nr:hypothetical protein [Actinomycetota bacterium]